MRYMVMVSMRPDVGPPPPELVEAMGEAMGEAFASGLLIDAGGLAPLPDSTVLSIRAGALSRVDGPFAEATEEVGG